MLESTVGYMTEIDNMVVVVSGGGVLENGVIVNKMGTYAMGIAARELGKLFYVAAKSNKFARLLPLNQSDLTKMGLEARLSFTNTAIWAVTGVVVGKRPLLSDCILLCELRRGAER